MIKTFRLGIVIPCFNEEGRLDKKRIYAFLKLQNQVFLCFVNDGSTDGTLEVLNEIKSKYKDLVSVISTEKNVGKAEAVRTGMDYCASHFEYQKIAYLDADLATTLEECLEISDLVKNETLFAFGSRIKKIDNKIDRKMYRFLIGRIIATFISKQLKLPVYDTQCGCKIFEKNLSIKLFAGNFISKWLFDVEIFHRILKEYGIDKTISISKEVPLKSWIDYDDSKVKFTYIFKLWFDLYRIGRFYKK